jgi:hypothetical protein
VSAVTIRDAAIALAAEGFRVFPLRVCVILG